MIKTGISDLYTGSSVRVSPQGFLRTESPGFQSLDSALVSANRHLLRDTMKTSAGSSDLNINGATTNVTFRTPLSEEFVQYVFEIRIIHHDAGMNLESNEARKFGDAAPAPGLTNGLRLRVNQEGRQTELFTNPVRSIVDYLGYAAAFVNLKDAISTGVDFLMVSFQFRAPVVLVPGTVDNLEIVVRDNLTAVDLMQASVIGYKDLLV